MGETLFRSTLSSPVGWLELVSTRRGLAAIALGERGHGVLQRWIGRFFPDAADVAAHGCHADYHRQLSEYFDSRRRLFDLTLDLRGSAFQRAVWQQVARIPFGSTACYSDIARLVGKPGAARAVGAANGANPIPIVIPCHRVIGVDGGLTGYGGGIAVKRWLLAHEGSLEAEAVQLKLFRRPAQPLSFSRTG